MEDNFSPQQSLDLIQKMIDKTKENITDNRFYFLLWGWLTFAAVLLQFFLKVVLEYKHHYLVWLVIFPAAIITIVKSTRQKNPIRTYIGDSMGFLWMGLGISFFILSIIISMTVGWYKAWPFFILFYGLGTFISGKIIQFQPLVIGGIICWILALVAALLPYDYQLLLAATAILISYIIPGHLLKSNKTT